MLSGGGFTENLGHHTKRNSEAWGTKLVTEHTDKLGQLEGDHTVHVTRGRYDGNHTWLSDGAGIRGVKRGLSSHLRGTCGDNTNGFDG
jgi:hypothetical protein